MGSEAPATARQHHLGSLGTACAILALLAACAPQRQEATPGVSPLDLAVTIVAGTELAQGTQTAAAAPAHMPATATATSKPTLYIRTDGAKCRSGPGTDFEQIAALSAGVSVDLVAKDSAEGYWLVTDPASGRTCWVFVQDATPGGSFELLPEVTPLPIAKEVPSAPINLSWPFYCSYVDGALYKITTDLSWVNTSSAANGFRVYRADQLVADVPASITEYQDTGNVVQGSDLTYSIEAYNEAGASPRLSQTIHAVCQ